MRECQQCGERNQATSRFCVVCGAPLALAPNLQPLPAPAAHAPDVPQPPSSGEPAPLAGGALPVVVPASPLPPAAPASFAAGMTGRPAAPAPARDVAAEFPLDGPRTLVGFLVSYEQVPLGQYWPIHQGRNVIGRQGAASGLDIEVSHPTTSSLHAVLLAAAQPGRVLVEDTNSTNGTFVNDGPIPAGERRELRDGDRIRFGLFNATIKIVEKT